MPKLTIVLPFKGAEKSWNLWAADEININFRSQKFEAERCTASFAALELKKMLAKSNSNLEFKVSETLPENGYCIILASNEKKTWGGFDFKVEDKVLTITGHDRNGLLNGIYEFLRLQGWRWLEPGIRGESFKQNDKLIFPEKSKEFTPSFKYRGIDCYRESHGSIEYLLWMARNRCNVAFRQSATGKLSDKLGMFSRAGGHLLYKILLDENLKPDRYLPSGKTIWESHPEWYGLPESGERTHEMANRVQICVSQEGVLNFIADEMISLLNGRLSDVDILDMWGFDTWGAICSCEACKKIGNGADHNLYLLSHLRTHLDNARKNGELAHDVLLDTVSYEGTVTLTGPSKDIPDNLIKAGDICIFYPIKRCYEHFLDDENCDINKYYTNGLLSWSKEKSNFSIWAGEYYNVSNYEDLPLLFTQIIPNDMRFYHQVGASGATYMHNIFTNWGVRSLTQLQHTQYSWDIDTDDEEFLNDYFENKYGQHAKAMTEVYDLVNNAGKDISAWRRGLRAVDTYLWGWDGHKKFYGWDGLVDAEPLICGHFTNMEDAIKTAAINTSLYKKAIDLLDMTIDEEKQVNYDNPHALGFIPNTPFEWDQLRYFDTMEYRLCEDRRMLEYGYDSMKLLSLLMNYYSAVLYDKPNNEIWEEIEKLATKMSNYYIPMAFDPKGAGVDCYDALTRTKLRIVILRCRKARKNGLVPNF